MKPVVSIGLAVFLALNASTAFAGGAYDGQWAVQLVTLKGHCDRSLSWDVGVAADRIADNGMMARTTGAVDASGRVRLLVTTGADRVSASGKLKGVSGAGAWSSPTRECSGRWRAENGRNFARPQTLSGFAGKFSLEGDFRHLLARIRFFHRLLVRGEARGVAAPADGDDRLELQAFGRAGGRAGPGVVEAGHAAGGPAEKRRLKRQARPGRAGVEGGRWREHGRILAGGMNSAFEAISTSAEASFAQLWLNSLSEPSKRAKASVPRRA